MQHDDWSGIPILCCRYSGNKYEVYVQKLHLRTPPQLNANFQNSLRRCGVDGLNIFSS